MSLLGFATINGTEATFRRIALGSVDVEAGTQATTTTDFTVHLINTMVEVDETADIDVNERKYRLVASEITGDDPDTEDQIIIGSVTYEIVKCKPVEKRAVVEFYDLLLRRIA
jgi:hypothetical protein